MNKTGDTQIAGSLTPDDWKKFRATLTPGGATDLWKKAFDDYFHTHLSLRYLGPIKVLQDNGTFQGEGFSIAAIQCSIVEFLESMCKARATALCGRATRRWGRMNTPAAAMLHIVSPESNPVQERLRKRGRGAGFLRRCQMRVAARSTHQEWLG